MARRLAIAISQAPGLRGTPDSGHCSSAATRASWASSSARPTSRTIRRTPAMIRADSIRQTASTAPCVSVAVTCQMTTPGSAPAQPGPHRLLPLALLFGHYGGVEVGQFDDPADLHLVVEHLGQ